MGGSPKCFDPIFKTQPSTDHGAKFRADRLAELGNFMAGHLVRQIHVWPVYFMSVNFISGHLVHQFHVRQIYVRHFQSTSPVCSCPWSCLRNCQHAEDVILLIRPTSMHVFLDVVWRRHASQVVCLNRPSAGKHYFYYQKYFSCWWSIIIYLFSTVTAMKT